MKIISGSETSTSLIFTSLLTIRGWWVYNLFKIRGSEIFCEIWHMNRALDPNTLEKNNAGHIYRKSRLVQQNAIHCKFEHPNGV